MNTKRFEKNITISIILVASLVTVYFWMAQSRLSVTDTTVQRETVLAAVQQKAEVPTDEIPHISVLRPEDVRQKEKFLLLAEADDYLLVYPKNRVAVLYRPSSQKVMSMVTLDANEWDAYFQSPSKQVAVDTEGVFRRSTDPLKLTVVSPLADIKKRQAVVRSLKDAYPTINIEEKNREQTTVYPTTLVADLSAENGDLVDAIAGMVNGEVVDQSPPGEITPETDILVLLGQDP